MLFDDLASLSQDYRSSTLTLFNKPELNLTLVKNILNYTSKFFVITEQIYDFFNKEFKLKYEL